MAAQSSPVAPAFEWLTSLHSTPCVEYLPSLLVSLCGLSFLPAQLTTRLVNIINTLEFLLAVQVCLVASFVVLVALSDRVVSPCIFPGGGGQDWDVICRFISAIPSALFVLALLYRTLASLLQFNFNRAAAAHCHIPTGKKYKIEPTSVGIQISMELLASSHAIIACHHLLHSSLSIAALPHHIITQDSDNNPVHSVIRQV